MENGKQSAFTGIVNEAYQFGLTKREYFAGLAMQSLCKMTEVYGDDPEVVAELSVDYADALLKELEK
jgi:hypothetical protein